jgi:hypothetical protein
MSASKTAGTSGQQTAGMGPTDDLTRTVQDGLAQAMAIPKRIIEANLDTGAELLTFMSRRMKAQADLFSGVGHSHDMTETSDMQRTFWEKVHKDYSEEMNHLAEIARKNFQIMSSLLAPHANDGAKQGRPM